MKPGLLAPVGLLRQVGLLSLLSVLSLLVACTGSEPAFEIDGTTGDVEQPPAGLPVSASCLEGGLCSVPSSCLPRGDGALCAVECAAPVDCPEEMTCTPESWCAWTVGTVGASCGSDAPCHGGLECQEVETGAFCTRPCDWNLPCPPGEDARCVKLAQGGNYCLRNCADGKECAPGLACTSLAEYPEIRVCYP